MRGTVRILMRSPGFSIAVIACWTLGLTTALGTYAIADAFFFRPPAHVNAPDRVVRLYGISATEASDGGTFTTLSYPHYDALRSEAKSAQYASYALAEQDVVVASARVRLSTATVSSNYFEVLGTTSQLGRLFGGETDFNSAPVAVVSTGVWRTYFAATRGIGNQTIRIRDHTFTVIGVAPEGFTGGEAARVDVWLPLDNAGDLLQGTEWKTADSWWLSLVGRLRPGVSRASTEAEAAVLLNRAFAQDHFKVARMIAAPLSPSSAPDGSPVSRAIEAVAAAGIVLLLIASLNVGGLFVLRGLARQREFATRHVLGAPISSIVADVIVEVITLGAVAGVTSILVVSTVGRAITGALAPETQLLSSVWNERSLTIALTVVVTGITIGALIACISAATTPPIGSMGGRTTQSARARRTRSIVVSVQTAMTTALIAGALVLTANLVALRSQDLGLNISGVQVVAASHSYTQERAIATAAMLSRMEADMKRDRYITAVSLAITAPFLSAAGVAVNAPDHPAVWQTKTGVPYLNAVGFDYFRTVGMHLEQGRFFAPVDSATGRRVVVINSTFAKLGWPGRSPIGRCIVLGAAPANPCYDVVGVVQDARRFTVAPEDATLQVYVPLSQNLFASAYPTSVLLAKTSEGLTGSDKHIADIARRDAPPQADVSITSLESLVDPQLRPWRTAGTLWVIFGAFALLLTSVGIYSVVAYSAEQQRRAIAVRMAFGATTGRLLVQIAARDVGISIIAVACGCATLFLVRRSAFGLLEVTRTWAPTLVGVAGLLVLVIVLVATALPVVRMSRQPLARTLNGD